MNFDKESKSEKKKKCGLKVVGGGGGGGGGGGEKERGAGNTETKTVSQNVERGKIQKSNHLHNLKHVVQSKFQNM